MSMDQGKATLDLPALEFDGHRGAFAKLLLINGFFTLITIGIYRFWAKTKVRRFFWSNVRFLDDPLEYTGTGGELFVGFLIVIAILFPLGLIYTAINAMVPPESVGLHIGLEVAYYLVIFALLQIGFYRMWRYRMSRTTWRGVRFGLDGSTWTYLKLASGWTLLTAITLGFAYPWMQIDLWRYQIRHTRIGSEIFKFDGNAKDLIWSWMMVYIPVLCIAGASICIMLSVDTNTGNKLPVIASENKDFVSIMGSIIGISYFAGFITFFIYQFKQARYQISGLRLGIASFKSALPVWRLFFFAVISVIIIIALFLLLGLILSALMNGVSLSTDISRLPSAFGIPMIIAGFAMMILVIPLIWAILFKFEVIKQTVITTTIENPHALEQAAQTASDAPRTGEGLADALDIGGF